MQLLPNLENNRPLAIGLLAIAVLAVYLVGFHWFVARHMELGEEIDLLEQQVARFKAAVERRPHLEVQLERLQTERLDSALFLPESNFNTAAAGMNRHLRDIISAEAESTELCSIVSTTNRPDQDPERFEQVTVNVRMNCPLPDLVKVTLRTGKQRAPDLRRQPDGQPARARRPGR
jgi:general secretion pathway protein M